ncbi:DUF1232 domain-containing protein [Bacillus sp. PS06]|uniref:DUF1232 domain-containing protein n=1 Tax=Bacillus sp. PS06 TaxID=2764176 RepID=UPI001CD91189|nr:DUF1232 domain-containing protein [Bacillus sp. PS06]
MKFWKLILFLILITIKRSKALGALIILTYAFFLFDLIPDFFTYLGINDEVVIATFVIERMVKIAPQSLKEKYKLDN